MSISTYTELQAAIANYAHRTDLTSRIPEFITMAEAKINREPALQDREIESSLAASIGSRVLTPPSGFTEARALFLTYFLPREPLTFVPADRLPEQISSGPPSYWSVQGGDSIWLDSTADKEYTFILSYTGIFQLSASSPTNWLLTNHPDIYLYASLVEMAKFARDDKWIAMYQGDYLAMMDQLKKQDSRKRGQATLFTDVPRRYKSNIIEG